MYWLVEDPTAWIGVGVVGGALLAIAFLQSGRVLWLGWLAALAVMVLAGVGFEWVVVTEREEVEQAVLGTAEALEANDLEAVLGRMTPDAATLRGRASDALRRFEIERVRCSDLQIQLQERTVPPTAIVKFMARISVKDRQGQSPYDSAVRRFTVTLRKRQGRWLLESYEDHDFRGEY